MKCLFIHLNRGCGVELIGDMFLDILKKFEGISQIDVWNIQCGNLSKNHPLPNNYDLVLINDPSHDCMTTKNLLSRVSCNTIFGISHGTLDDIPSYYSAVLELNFESICHNYNEPYISNHVFPLKYVPGNIWHDYTDEDNRNDESFLFCGRITPEKLPLEAVELLYENRINLDVYGPIVDPDHFSDIQTLITYKGNKTHKELVDIYNIYNRFFMASTTECLSLSLREALLCGCKPYVIDQDGYTASISNYIVRANDYYEFQNILDNLSNCNPYIHPFNFQYEFSFDKMILDILIYFRGFFGKTFKFNKHNECIVNYLLSDVKINDKQSHNYSYDIIDWNKVKL